MHLNKPVKAEELTRLVQQLPDHAETGAAAGRAG